MRENEKKCVNLHKIYRKMKKTFYVPLMFAGLLLCNCHCAKTAPKDGDDKDSTKVTDTLTVADSTMWGRMGEGTSMNVMEFVTEKGDTLYLSRYSESTGLDAQVIGDIRNFSDRFAVTTRGTTVDEGQSLQTCVNVSQMMGLWKSSKGSLTLYADGTADNGAANYTSWQMCNGKLVLSGKVTTEYGETARIDTMLIEQLDDDSLKLTTPQHEIISYGR